MLNLIAVFVRAPTAGGHDAVAPPTPGTTGSSLDNVPSRPPISALGMTSDLSHLIFLISQHKNFFLYDCSNAF